MGISNRSRAFASHILLFVSVIIFSYVLRVYTPTISGEHLYSQNDYNENIRRVKEAQDIIDKTSLFPLKNDSNGSVEVRIVASDRRHGYLVRVIGTFLKTFEGKKMPSVTICNAEGYLFYELKQFQNKIFIWDLGENGPFDRNDLNSMIKEEASDYWKCLSMKSSSRYLLVLQDDALVVPRFPELLSSILKQLDDRRDIDFVKLFHPEYLRKIPAIPLKITISILIAILFYSTKRFRSYEFFSTFLILCAIIHHQMDNQLLVDLRFALTNSVYLTMPESCCIPGVIFRNETKDILASELMKEMAFAGHANDHILDESRFVGRQTDGNLVVHIGKMSSIR